MNDTDHVETWQSLTKAMWDMADAGRKLARALRDLTDAIESSEDNQTGGRDE
jgi:hypothetical protein